MRTNYKEYSVLDQSTGEVLLKEGVFISKEQNEAFIQKRNREVAIAGDPDYCFVWFLFKYGEEIFPTLTPANITRLFYVATFCNYEGYLANSNGTPLTKAHIKKKLGLSDSVNSGFWKELLASGILSIGDDNIIYVNEKYFRKGSMRSNSSFTRIYSNFIRTIYEDCLDNNKHKLLSYIFRLIPYVNYTHNVVCRNPDEKDIDRIEPTTVKELCEILNYSATNGRRLLDEMLHYRVGGEHLIGLWGHSLDVDKHIVFVNPKIFYAGPDPHDIRNTFELSAKFEIGSKF